jgi:redox-sensing transcriptional repressor
MNKDVVARFSKYRSLLLKLKSLGLERIFSNNLGDAIGVTPALVRKDFSLLKLPGNKRGGYLIDVLLERLNTEFGKDKTQEFIIVGAGKIGTALMQYRNFFHEGLSPAAAFDTDPAKLTAAGQVPVLPMENLEEFIKTRNIKIAINAVPDAAAAAAVERLIRAGIQGILNFAPVELKSQENCLVHNFNIALELENLFYMVNLMAKKE